MDETPPEDYGDFNNLKEKYCNLKRLYDEVIDSNSQMVLKLEEAKWALSKNTNEQQELNNELMFKNMVLRKEKQQLFLEMRKLKSQLQVVKKLVNQALVQVDAQSVSIKCQENCLVNLHAVVSKCDERNEEDFNIPLESTHHEHVESNDLSPDVLYEMKRSFKASCGQVGLSPIEEESPPRGMPRRDSLAVSSVPRADVASTKMGWICDSVGPPGEDLHPFINPVYNQTESTSLLEASNVLQQKREEPLIRDNNGGELNSFNIDAVKTLNTIAAHQSSTDQGQQGTLWSSLATEYNRTAEKVSCIEGHDSWKPCRQFKILDDNRLIVGAPGSNDPNVSDSCGIYKSLNIESRDWPRVLMGQTESNSSWNLGKTIRANDAAINQNSRDPIVEDSKILVQGVHKDPTTQTDKISSIIGRDPSTISPDDEAGLTSNYVNQEEQNCQLTRARPRLTFVIGEQTPEVVEEESPPRRIMTRARSKPRKNAMPEDTELKKAQANNEVKTKSKRTAFKKPVTNFEHGEGSDDLAVTTTIIRRKKRR